MCSRLPLKSSDSSDVPPAGRFKTHNFASDVYICIFPFTIQHDAQTSLLCLHQFCIVFDRSLAYFMVYFRPCKILEVYLLTYLLHGVESFLRS